LLERSRGAARLCILEDLGQETERVTRLSPEEAKDREFSPLNMVVIFPEVGAAPFDAALQPPGTARLHLGLPEAAFAHQRGLITKAEVRAVVLAKLELHPGLVLWDVGAGCGSVGLEASLLLPGGRIIAVEQDRERAAQIQANREKFGVGNLEVVSGHAPKCLADLPDPQRVFIGGGGRDLEGILKMVLSRLDRDGKMVLTATLLETLEAARRVLPETGWRTEVIQLQVSRSQPLGGGIFMQALNPVWIVTAYQ
jgi:precorrin-6Y C5,15-methyltransferase (decarboxylating)